VTLYALLDSRISRRELGHGDLYLTREEAEKDLADVLHDEPDLEPFLSMVKAATAGAIAELGLFLVLPTLRSPSRRGG
jgi:hypothetical protein